MPSNFKSSLARMPVAGYLLRLVHDLVKLPVIRADLHRDCSDLAARLTIQDNKLAAISERLAQTETTAVVALRQELASLAARETTLELHLETLLQRVSDNLAEWADLRRQFVAGERKAAARIDEALARLVALQADLGSLEENFGGVLRHHARLLASLQPHAGSSAHPPMEIPGSA